MGVQRTSFEKLQRERAKKAKAAAKRARREERAAEAAPDADADALAEDTETGDPEVPLSADELLRLVALTHSRFEAGLMGFEEYEEKKAELLARLPVD
jgi:hypothetical protein